MRFENAGVNWLFHALMIRTNISDLFSHSGNLIQQCSNNL